MMCQGARMIFQHFISLNRNHQYSYLKKDIVPVQDHTRPYSHSDFQRSPFCTSASLAKNSSTRYIRVQLTSTHRSSSDSTPSLYKKKCLKYVGESLAVNCRTDFQNPSNLSLRAVLTVRNKRSQLISRRGDCSSWRWRCMSRNCIFL